MPDTAMSDQKNLKKLAQFDPGLVAFGFSTGLSAIVKAVAMFQYFKRNLHVMISNLIFS
jgi:hypothetical protein